MHVSSLQVRSTLPVSGGVVEREFTLGEVTGVIWSPEAAADAPILLSGHGGGMHKRAPGLVASALASASAGFHVVAIDAPGHGDRPADARQREWSTAIRAARKAGEPIAPIAVEHDAALAARTVPEWQATIDAVQTLPDIGERTRFGFGGQALGVVTGVMLAAADPRIVALNLGSVFVGPELLDAASRVHVPVELRIPWDDEYFERRATLGFFDALGSNDKTLHAHAGPRRRRSADELDDAVRFFDRHLRPDLT